MPWLVSGGGVRYLICRYHGCVLVLLAYDERQDDFTEAFERFVVSAGSLCCGVSDELAFDEGDLGIRQALECLESARGGSAAFRTWFSSGRDAFSSAASADRLFSHTALAYRAVLEAYDRANDAELLETARALVDSFGEVKTAADALYQHPNTVRYRLKKIKALMGMEGTADREFFVFLSLVFLARERDRRSG